MLGVEPTFDVDSAALERAYLARSAVLHPAVAAGDEEAARRMAAVNHARRVLEDPERRAEALLARLGGPAKESERGLPEGFLAGMMETREEIESARGDAGDRARWESWAHDRRREAIDEIGAMFRSMPAGAREQALRAIRVRLNAWRYVERLIEQ